MSATPAAPDVERWCDAYTPGPQGALLELPTVALSRDGAAPFTLPEDKWIWVNLWATWCVPCKREMPLLIKWRDQLRRDGVPFELVFLSVDDTAEVLSDFLAAQEEMAPEPSLRLVQPGALANWLQRYEPDASNAIPVHIIAAPGGRVRCVRSGSLRDGDYATVRALMR